MSNREPTLVYPELTESNMLPERLQALHNEISAAITNPDYVQEHGGKTAKLDPATNRSHLILLAADHLVEWTNQSPFLAESFTDSCMTIQGKFELLKKALFFDSSDPKLETVKADLLTLWLLNTADRAKTTEEGPVDAICLLGMLEPHPSRQNPASELHRYFTDEVGKNIESDESIALFRSGMSMALQEARSAMMDGIDYSELSRILSSNGVPPESDGEELSSEESFVE